MKFGVFKVKYCPTALINFDEIQSAQDSIYLKGKAKGLKFHVISLLRVLKYKDM